MRYNTLNLWDDLNFFYTITIGSCLNYQTTTYESTLPLKLSSELLCCRCSTTLLLLLGTLSNIVPHLATSKSFHFVPVLLILFTMSSRLLLLGPNFRPLLSLLLSLGHKGKINLIPILTMLLTSRSRAMSSLLLHKVISEPLPTGHMLPSHDAMYKTLPLFGKAIQGCLHQLREIYYMANCTHLNTNLSET
jgi:hypothetical protein